MTNGRRCFLGLLCLDREACRYFPRKNNFQTDTLALKYNLLRTVCLCVPFCQDIFILDHFLFIFCVFGILWSKNISQKHVYSTGKFIKCRQAKPCKSCRATKSKANQNSFEQRIEK